MARLQKRKQGTATSAFGTPGRISHDASKFYGARLYEGLDSGGEVNHVESAVPPEYLNRVFCKSSEAMSELPDNSVHLMITSPPYNVSKEYDEDLSLDEYLALLNTVWRETWRVLVPGGRACVNVANLGRKPYIPLHSYIIEGMQSIGFLMRGEILWNKGSSASPSTAWGSWQSAANPVLRDVHEYILVFSKDSFSRKRGDRENTIKKGGISRMDQKRLGLPGGIGKENRPSRAIPGRTPAPADPAILVQGRRGPRPVCRQRHGLPGSIEGSQEIRRL